MIKIVYEEDGCFVYLDGKLQHQHNWRSFEAVSKWVELCHKIGIPIKEVNNETK